MMIKKFVFCFLISIFDKKKRYIILNPDLSFFFINKILIYDKKLKNFFTQKIERYGDLITIFEIFFDNAYDIKKFEFWKKIKLENKTPLIIDCGANIGSSTVFFSKNHTDSHIYSIEPEINNFNLLKININKLKNIEIINSAVSSKPFRFKLIRSKDSRSHKIKKNATNRNNINTITINNILKKYPNNKFSYLLIKIDIEGFEKELFKNNTNWLDKFKIIIIELHDWMVPFTKNSYYFQKSIFKSKVYKDIIVSGENLILVNY